MDIQKESNRSIIVKGLLILIVSISVFWPISGVFAATTVASSAGCGSNINISVGGAIGSVIGGGAYVPVAESGPVKKLLTQVCVDTELQKNKNITNTPNICISDFCLPPQISALIPTSWDDVAYMLSKTITTAMINQIDGWINSGFRGGPAFA